MRMFAKRNTKVHTVITEQIKDVRGCLVNFENFIKAAVTPNTPFETLRALSSGVHEMENAADRSLRRMIDSLSEGSMLPSTKEDLIAIATSCDKIANKCEHIAMMMVVQHYSFPEGFPQDILRIIDIQREQFAILEESISMMFSRFNELLQDHDILDRIREYESRVDAIEERLYEYTFDMDTDLAHKMQTSNFVELICDISDIIEDIADRIQIMLITRKA